MNVTIICITVLLLIYVLAGNRHGPRKVAGVDKVSMKITATTFCILLDISRLFAEPTLKLVNRYITLISLWWFAYPQLGFT